MDGFNTTILAYGHKGTGKTFTMLGPEKVAEFLVNQSYDLTPETESLYGLIPRAILQIFQNIEAGKLIGTKYTIKVNFIEIYNECINDILALPPSQNLKIKEFTDGTSIFGIEEKLVNSPQDIFECISVGLSNKIVYSVGQDFRNNKSNTILIVTCQQVLLDERVLNSKLMLIDLAGSEINFKLSGQEHKEANVINHSLNALGHCIVSLTNKNIDHVPYKESKLTMLMKDSFGGNSRTTIIITGSLNKENEDDTLSSLVFAERARQVKNLVQANVKRPIKELEMVIENMKKDMQNFTSQNSEGQGIVADNIIELNEIKAKYEILQSTSSKRIEEINAKLIRAECSGALADYEQERALLKHMLEQRSEEIQKINKEKEMEKKAHENFIEEIVSKNSEMTGKIMELTQELSLAQKHFGALKSEISSRDEHISEILQEKKHLIIEKKEYKEMLCEAKNHSSALENKKKALETENHELIIKLQDSMTAKTDNDLAIDKLEYYTQALVNEVESLEKSNEQHIQKIEELKANAIKLHKENEELKNKCKELEKYKSIIEEKKASWENTQMKSEKTHEKQERDKLYYKEENDEKTADEKIAGLKIELEQALSDRAETIKVMQDFKQEYDFYQITHRGIFKECEELKQLVSVLSQTNEMLQKDLTSEIQNSSKLQKNLQFHEDNREKLIKDIENSIKIKMQLNTNSFIKQINELQESLNNSETEIKNLKALRKKDNKKLNSELEDAKNTISLLNSQIKNLTEEFDMKTEAIFQEKEALKIANSDKMNENFHLKIGTSERNDKISMLNARIKELEELKNNDFARDGLFRMKKKPEKMSYEMIRMLYSN